MKSQLLGLEASETIVPINENDTIDLGQGYDTLTDMFHDGIVAVAGSMPPADGIATGQKTYAYFDVVESTTEFLETLNISMSASAKGFGGKASASYSLYRSLTMNTKDVFALFYISVIDKVHHVYDPALSDRAKEEWANNSKSNMKPMLVNTYGDSYVSRVVTGGQLLAAFKINATSRKVREEVKISASAAFASFRASGDYKYIEEFFSNHNHTVMDIRRDGGDGDLPQMDLKSLLDAAIAFPTRVREHPVQIFAVAKPISHLQDGNTNINLHSSKASDVVHQLGMLQATIRERKNEAEFILSTPELFTAVENSDIKASVSMLDDYVKNALTIYDQIIEDRFNFKLEKELPDARVLPKFPGVIKGKAVPVTLHLNGKYPLGGAWDVEGSSDKWVPADALFGLSIDCPALPAGTSIEYHLKDHTNVTSPDVKQGSTAIISKGAEYAVGITIKMKGEFADNYTITYAIRTAAGNATYYAQDGEEATAWRNAYGWRITALKVNLALS